MNIKSVLTASLVALTATMATASAEALKIGVAAEPYPPFAAPDAAGNWVGWEVDIIGAVCAQAKLECVITPVAWDGMIPSLTGKQIDVIMASMSINEERLKTIDFSDFYYNEVAVIVAEKGMAVDATADSLKGKIVGVQASTTHAAYAQKHFAAGSEIKIYQTQDEANQDLVAGRLDAIQADSIAMAEFVGGDAGACCEIKGPVANDQAIFGPGIGAGVRKGEDELKATLNAAIAAILADGTHAKITANYFTAPIYSK
jgi:polar amino acid transport system substrate-binding protein